MRRRRRLSRAALEAAVGRLAADNALLRDRVRFLEAKRLPAPLWVLGPTRGAQEHAED